MPEAAVDENYCMEPRQNQVRVARKVRGMQSESVARPVENAPYDHLRRRVAAPDPVFMRAMRACRGFTRNADDGACAPVL